MRWPQRARKRAAPPCKFGAVTDRAPHEPGGQPAAVAASAASMIQRPESLACS